MTSHATVGTIIEQNGDGLLEDSHMPDGRYTLMVPSDNVAFIDLQPTRARRHVGRIRHERDSVEINHRAPQWSHNAVWNRKYMEPKPGYTLRQLWADSEPAIGH